MIGEDVKGYQDNNVNMWLKTKVFYERKRNVMLEFVISTILSGIIWDVIKGSQKLLYHYSLKKMNIAEAELTNLIENIPQE